MITFNEYQEVSDLRSNFRTELLEEVYAAVDRIAGTEILEESVAKGFNRGMDHYREELLKALEKIAQ